MSRMDINERMDRLMNQPAYRQLDDSERNQLAGLEHEACETHCDDCGRCLGKDAEPVTGGPFHITYRDVEFTTVGDADYCEDCTPNPIGASK